MNDPVLNTLFERPVERFVLDNGLVVVHAPDAASDVVSVQVWAKAGSIHEGAWMGCGLSHYLEHMLFKGTKRRSFRDLSSDVQAAGGSINAYTTFDRTVYYIDGPANEGATFFDVLADMVFESQIDEAEATREKNVILREIDMGKDDPDRYHAQLCFEEAFRTHPYKQPIIGHRSLFEGVSVEDLRSYYRSRYAPNNLVLVVAGGVDTDQVRAWAAQYFAAEPMRRVEPAWVPPEPKQLGARSRRVEGNYQVTRGSVLYRVPGMHHESAAALDLLASILGQGNSSLLWQRLHEELGLVHYIDASCWNPGQAGMFWISYSCDNGEEQAVREAIEALVAGLGEQVLNEQVLAKAQRRAVVSQVNACKSASAAASRLGVLEVVAGELDYPKVYFEQVFAQTPQSLCAVAKTYLCPSGQSCVELAGKAELEEEAPQVFTPKGGGLPDFREVTLPNGVRLLLQQVGGLPKVHFKAVCLGGPAYEGSTHKGATALMATLLARDTQSLSSHAVASRIESLGGSFSEFSGNNTFGLSLEVLSSDVPTALETLSDALLRSAFNPRTFEQERDSQCGQIRETLDEAVDYARLRLRQRFFGAHPFGVDALGTLEALEGLGLDQLCALREQFVVPENLILSVSGDFDESSLEAQLSEAFAPMVGATFSPTQTPFGGMAEQGYHCERTSAEQTVVHCAFADGGVRGADNDVAEVLDEIFSGLSSVLFEKVRERRGLAYYVYASRLLGLDYGAFAFCAGTTWEAHEEVLAIMDEELARVAQGGLEAAELERCRTHLKAQQLLQLQSPSARAMHAALNVAYGLPLNRWRTQGARVDGVSAQALAEYSEQLRTGGSLRLVHSPHG